MNISGYRGVGVVLFLSIFSLLAFRVGGLAGQAGVLAVSNVITLSGIEARIVHIVLSFSMLFAICCVYLWYSGRGLSYIDVSWPTYSEWGYITTGAALSLFILVITNIIISYFRVPTGESTTVATIGHSTEVAILFVFIVFLFNAPVEEILFRNIVQKQLTDIYHPAAAIGVASVLFMLMHLPAYTSGTVSNPQVVISLGSVFCSSTIYGYIYYKTENVLVPSLAHSFYNTVQIGLIILL